jgi:hypothetical protein
MARDIEQAFDRTAPGCRQSPEKARGTGVTADGDG